MLLLLQHNSKHALLLVMLVSTPFDIPLSPDPYYSIFFSFSPHTHTHAHTFQRRGPKWKLQVGGYRDLQEMNQSAGIAILAHDRPTCFFIKLIHMCIKTMRLGVFENKNN